LSSRCPPHASFEHHMAAGVECPQVAAAASSRFAKKHDSHEEWGLLNRWIGYLAGHGPG
jgi:hypothetical protein